MSRRRQIAFIVLGAAVVAQAARSGISAAVIFGGVLIAVNIAGAHWMSLSRGRPAGSALSFSTPLAICWLLVSILPVHRFSASAGAAASRRLIEFAVFTSVGVVAVLAIKAFEQDLQHARPPVFLFLIPVWAFSSAFWGDDFIHGFSHGLQFMTIAVLAWATVSVGRRDPSAIRAMLATYLRWFVRVTAVLAIAGMIWGPVEVLAREETLGRFTWIGVHPNGSGLILSVALVIAVATPPKILRLPPPVILATIAGFLVALYYNHGRAAWAALVLSLVIILVTQGRISPRVAWIGIPFASAVATAALWLNGTAIWDYLLRDQTTDAVQSGNGRIELWGIGFRALDSVFEWLGGLGYGAARFAFRAEAPWAGSSHNVVLGYLVELGLIGVAVFLYCVVVTGLRLLNGRMWSRPDDGVPLSALLVAVLLNAMTFDTMAIPSLGFSVLYMVAAIAIVNEVGTESDSPPTEHEEAGEVRPTDSRRGQITSDRYRSDAMAKQAASYP